MSDHPTQRSLRILVADDEPMIVRALVRVLERGGHAAHQAGSALEAIAVIDEQDLDVVMVDQNMPGSGLSVLEHLAKTNFDGTVVLMTGGMDSGEADRVALDVIRLQKPFRFSEITDLIERRSHGG